MEDSEKKLLMQKVEKMLNNNLSIVDDFVEQKWLAELESAEVLNCAPGTDTDMLIELFDIEKIVYDSEESSIDKLASVYSSMNSYNATVFLIIKSNGDFVKIYMGCRHYTSPQIAGDLLKKSLCGNFQGLRVKPVINKEKVLNECVPLEYSKLNIAALSVKPSFRNESKIDNKKFIQGLEKFIDAMSGEKYTAMIIAEPVNVSDLKSKKNTYEKILTELSKFNKFSVSYGENNSLAVTNGMSESLSHTVSDSIGDSESLSTSRSVGKTKGSNRGSSYSFLLGINNSSGASKATTTSNGKTKTITKTTTETNSQGETVTTNESETETNGNTISVTMNIENKHISGLVKNLETTIGMFEKAETFGMWETAAYFLSSKYDDVIVAANNFKSIIIGEESGNERSFINTWDSSSATYSCGKTKNILKFLHYGMHPVFSTDVVVAENERFNTHKEHLITPAMLVSGRELPIVMGLPKKSVTGITVLNSVEYGRNIVRDSDIGEGFRKVMIGNIVHMGSKERTKVDLSVNSLSSHCFICGTPGSGKSNAVYNILHKLIDLDNGSLVDEGYKGVKFLIIEPAKGEYKFQFGGIKRINIFTTSPSLFTMLRLNPFEFPYKQIHVREHLDRLIEVFSACWPLFAAMPAILKESFEKAYLHCGWDLKRSIYILPGEIKFPTFNDILRLLPIIINNSAYSANSKGDYIGSLVTRVASLTNGIMGDIFCGTENIDDKTLFDENTIVDLSRVGSTETKALIMGVLVIKLNEYRIANATKMNYPLRHITVLEEAHNILPRTSTSQSADSANVLGKSVEMISASIAEMRTYGEGFLIVDQSPSAVAQAAISNTNTKIIMRLSDYEDCQAVGHSIGLGDAQIDEITRLPRGHAIIRQSNWIDPVMVLFDKASIEFEFKGNPKNDYNELKCFRFSLLEKIFQVVERTRVNDNIAPSLVEVISQKINRSGLPQHDIMQIIAAWRKFCYSENKRRTEYLARLVVEILCFEDALKILVPNLPNIVLPYSAVKRTMIYDANEWLISIGNTIELYTDVDDDFALKCVYNIIKYCYYFPYSKKYKFAAHIILNEVFSVKGT